MCTVTWLRAEQGYELLCNRDEKHARSIAQPPSLVQGEWLRFVAPRDPDGGGTWLAVNEHALCVTLLNVYDAACTQPANPISRGTLVWSLAGSAASARQAADQLRHTSLEDFPPFTLALLDLNETIVCQWDRISLQIRDRNADALLPLTSSSYETDDVCASRRRDYLRRTANGRTTAELLDFHTSHGASPSAYSTCMHRADAATVSFSWIRATRGEVRFFYSPSAPCEWSASAHSISLPLNTGAVTACL